MNLFTASACHETGLLETALELIGEGGMGMVYLTEQQEPSMGEGRLSGDHAA